MMIIVKKLVYDPVAYSPTTEEAAINTDHIVSVVPIETRRSEECVQILLANGVQLDCVGKPRDFFGK